MPAYSILYKPARGLDGGVCFSASDEQEALLKFNEWAERNSPNCSVIRIEKFDAFNQSIFNAFERGEASTIGD